jgi:hypothetical protein
MPVRTCRSGRGSWSSASGAWSNSWRLCWDSPLKHPRLEGAGLQ